MKKRILSLLMALALCLSLLPTMALAKGGTPVDVTGVQTSSGDGASTVTLEGTFEDEDGTKSVELTFELDVEYVSGTTYSTTDTGYDLTASAEIDGANGDEVSTASLTVTDAKSGGVVEIDATVNMVGTKNYSLTAHWDNYQEHDDVKFEPWPGGTGLPTEAGNYYLTDDVTLNKTWTVPAGTTNLCLNGHVIKLADDATGSVINALGNATLNLYDCNDDAWPHLFAYSKTGAWKLLESYEGEAPVTIEEITSATKEGTAVLVEGGVITGGTGTSSYNSLCGGAVFVGGGATFNMYGGNIVGNHVTGCGGGVYVLFANSGSTTFNLYGGRICGNAANHGAGVHMNGDAFTIYGGSIENNTATGDGGGVCINSNGFTMHGGTIRNNVANHNGGGVCNGGSGFAMDGGTITGNTVNGNYGGGVYVGNTSITLGGDAKIIGNTVNNLYLGANYTSGTMTVTFGNGSTVAVPKSGMKVSVTLVNSDNIKASFTDANASYEAYANYFEADKTYQYILFDDSKIQVNRVNSSSSKKVNISPSEHGVVYTDKQIAGNGDTVTLTVVPENGYVLKSLKYNDGTDHDIVADAQGAYKFTMPNTAVTVVAVFAPSWGKLNDALAGTQGTLDGVFKVENDTPETGTRTITLLTDITAGEGEYALTVPSGKKVVLDLNGHVLDRGLSGMSREEFADYTTLYCWDDYAETGSVIIMQEDADLTIKDSNTEQLSHKFTMLPDGEKKGLWMLDEANGDKTVTGGCITGGMAWMGGGIFASLNDDPIPEVHSSLTLEGGNIVGNVCDMDGWGGAGVCIWDGLFTMKGGSITGNYSNGGNVQWGYGGGVYLSGDTVEFIMNSGTISENYVTDSGAGVYLTYGAKFTMNDGYIKDNVSTASGIYDVEGSHDGFGGGVYMSGDGSETFTMNGGEISGNEAPNAGGGIYVGYGLVFDMKDGSIKNNKSLGTGDGQASLVDNADGFGGGVYVCNDASFTMNDGIISGNESVYGGGIYNDWGTVNLTAYEGKQVSITGNTASMIGGAAWYNSAVTISGTVIIKENTSTLGFDNLTASEAAEPVSVTGDLTDSEIYASIVGKVYDEDTGEEYDGFVGGILTDGYIDKNPSAGPEDFFHYEGSADTCKMILNSDGELAVVMIAPIYNYAPFEDKDKNHGYITVPEKAFPGDTVTVTVAPNDGYQMKGLWYYDENYGGYCEITDTKTFNMPYDDYGWGTDVKAEFEKKAESSGGSSGGSSTVTVPVTGDGNKVNVSASVSGSTATVKAITDAELDRVTGGEAVEIDLTGLKKNIDTAKISTATVEKIGDKGGMSVKLTTATVTFDKAATQEISAQAGGNTIQLVVDDIKEVSLNAVQKEAVKKLDTALIIDAYLVSNGTRLCSESKGGFNGGKATVALPFEIKNNRTSANYSVYYVDAAGNLEKLNAKYDSKLGAFVFDITHFSNYVVAYDENAALAFTDVPVDQYFYNAVKWAAANGITEGTSAMTFSPYVPVTRAQVVTFLWRTAGCPEPKGDASKFTDVEIGSYYEKAVAWAIEQVITKGTSETTFSPDAVCTRGQIVTFLARFAGVADDATGYTHGFTDVKATDYFNNAVAWAKDNKVTEGTSATMSSPNDDCTRAQVVTFLYRWMVK